MKADYDQAKREAAEAKSETKHAIAEKEAIIETLEATIVTLKEDLEVKSSEKVKLKNAMRDLESQLVASNKQTIVNDEKVTFGRSTMAAKIQSEKQELESRFDALSEKSKMQSKTVKTLKAEVADLKKSLGLARVSTRDAEEELGAKVAEHQTAVAEKVRLSDVMRDLESRLVASNQRIAEIQSENQELSAERDRAVAELENLPRLALRPRRSTRPAQPDPDHPVVIVGKTQVAKAFEVAGRDRIFDGVITEVVVAWDEFDRNDPESEFSTMDGNETSQAIKLYKEEYD